MRQKEHFLCVSLLYQSRQRGTAQFFAPHMAMIERPTYDDALFDTVFELIKSFRQVEFHARRAVVFIVMRNPFSLSNASFLYEPRHQDTA